MADKGKKLEAMQVTSFRSWTVLWGLGAVLAGVIVWAIVGSLPERIEGKGMLQTKAGTQQITAPGEGVITQLHFKEGDQVTDGQLVASVSSATMDESTIANKRRYDEAVRAHQSVEASERGTVAALQSEEQRTRVRLREAESRHAELQKYLKQGTVPQSTVDAAKNDVDSLRSQLNSLSMRVRARYDVIDKSAQRVRAAEIELRRAMGTASQVSKVNSTVGGRVTLIHKRPGDRVFPGQPIADVQSSAGGDTVEVVAYIAASNGKRVLPGQPVRLAVAGVPTEEFGYLLGEVDFVSPYPVSAAAAQSTLKDESWSDASYEVRIRPLAVAEGQPRYRWTGSGNNEKVLSGTSVTVAVQVADRKPYTLVLPLKKEDRVPVAERTATVPPGSSN
jgi:HlyD family secretion protein